MKSLLRTILLPGVLLAVACGGSSSNARAPNDEKAPKEETDLNRTHRHVKEEINRASEETRKAVESVQHDLHDTAHDAGKALGVRPDVTGTGDAAHPAPAPSGSAAPPADSAGGAPQKPPSP